MNDIDFLNEFVLAQFIVNRIYNNHRIYCQDYDKKDTFVMDNEWFKLIILSLLYELKQGNTIFVIDSDFKQKIYQYIDYFYQYFDLDKDGIAKQDLIHYLRQMIIEHRVDLNGINDVHLLAVINNFEYVLNCFDKKHIDDLYQLFDLFNRDSLPPFVMKKYDASLVIWLYRSYQAEYALAQRISHFSVPSSDGIGLSDEKLDGLNTEQKLAIKTALHHRFCMITGGPGTGKTHTVAQLVRILIAERGVEIRQIALAAPTGKAAQRMQESLQQSIQHAQSSQALEGMDLHYLQAQTIHRLLGFDGARPKFHADNPLPYKVVIVDEASMLGVELASQLLMALSHDARIVFLGDSHQLSAVDAGAVLADLCQVPMIQHMRVELIKSNRFDAQSGVGRLAALTNRHDNDKMIDGGEIQNIIDNFDTLHLFSYFKSNNDLYKKLSLGFDEFYKKLIDNYYKNKDDINMMDMMSVLNQYRILCASHHGIKGTKSINEAIKQNYLKYLAEHNIFISHANEWYHGRVIMISQNNYNLQLYNGDIGICLMTDKGLMVFFENKTAPILPNLLESNIVQTAYAMTIHKSQGSEFYKVAICLDEGNTRLLGGELIYTAITRAKVAVDIYATIDLLQTAIHNKTIRRTGLPLIFDDIYAQ